MAVFQSFATNILISVWPVMLKFLGILKSIIVEVLNQDFGISVVSFQNN